MADIEFGGFDSSDPEVGAGVFSRIVNWIGAASSIALVAGLAFWGYQLTIRDVTDVPVIRALEGPARVQPADPGGQLAQHQGLAVNNVQADGTAEGPTEQVILAPAPIDLEAEDVIRVAEPSASATIEEPTPISLDPAEIDPNDPVAQALALAEQVAEGTEPLAQDEVTATRVALAIPARGFDPQAPGVKRSPRPVGKPKVNPAVFQQNAAINAAVTAAVGAGIDADPTSITPGMRLVQLGAYDDKETAMAEWDKLAVEFNEYLDGKKRLILEAQSGGRKFYRLRAVGFDDLNASRRFCAVLVASSAACIPVLAR